MTQDEFLAQKVFIGLTNKNEDENSSEFYFSEDDFAEVLKHAEYFGMSIYDINTTLNGEVFKSTNHETFRKKATDSSWYNKEFKHLRLTQTGLLYNVKCKVSKKLLARE